LIFELSNPKSKIQNRKSMKVALIQFGFPYYTVELANSLAEKVELTLIQPDKWADYVPFLDRRIKVLPFHKYRIRDPRNILAMRTMLALIDQVQPDVIHVQETNEFWYDFALLWRSLFGSLFGQLPPLVTTIHDLARHPGDRDLTWGSEYTRRISYGRSQQLIVHTQTMRQELIQTFHRPQQQVQVVPHGQLGGLYQRWADETVERDPYTLLFFGRIWQYKGLKYLVEAMEQVVQIIPQAKVIVAGRGDDLNQYFANGIDPRHYEIRNDFIPQEAVAGLFQRSAAVVLPYIEASQSGVAAIAYGTGTPVIASDIGGLGELVRHGEDGLLVPPANATALAAAIVQLLSDRNLQKTMQKNAWHRSQTDLNWGSIATQTVEVYTRAIARGSKR
jgi:glycosyltransferase involved in cell wall biosynthesis